MMLTGEWAVWALVAAAGLSGLSLVIALVAFQLRHRGRRGIATHACGHCGYDVRGLPTFACPECGSDLREVGIVRGSAPPALVLLLSAVGSCWLRMLLASLALAALLGLGAFGAIEFVLSHDVYPSSEAVLRPESGAYRLRLAMNGKARHVSGSRNAAGQKVSGEALSVSVGPADGVVDYNTDLHIDLPTWSCNLYRWVAGRAESQKAVAFNRAELERLLQANGIDTGRTDVQGELDSLLRLIDACRADLVHHAALSAGSFHVVSAADTTTVQYAGASPIGPILLGGGTGLWLMLMTAMLILSMWRLRDGVPVRAGIGRDSGPSGGTPPSAPVARTVTVLFSDIKDYTARSAAADRVGAIELVRRHRELANPIIRQRRGAVVKTIGDALLVTFESATDAVLAGLEIQAAVAGHNAVGDAERLELRIAVATGEVIVEAGDVYGDTVNLASRLQHVAPPGSVLLSAATRALVNEREVRVDSAGEFELAGVGCVPAFVARHRGMETDA